MLSLPHLQPAAEEREAKSSKVDILLPATRPEEREVRTLVSPGIVIKTWPRPALSGISIHRRFALGGLGGFGAGIRRRSVGRRGLDHGRFDIANATRPAEIVCPSARRRGCLPFGERAGHGCARGGSRSGADSPHQFFGRKARLREWYDRPGCRSLRRFARSGIGRLRARTDRHWQRDRHALVADDALDFALDIMGELKRTKLRKVAAVART